MTVSESDDLSRDLSGPAERHLVYIHGFDMRGPLVYRGLMAEELEQYGAIRGKPRVIGKRRRAEGAPRGSAIWRMRAGEGPDRVDCDVHYLAWQDIVGAALRAPVLSKGARGMAAVMEVFFGGTARELYRRNWPSLFPILYPFFAALVLIVIGLLPLLWIGAAPVLVVMALTAAWITLLFRITVLTDKWTFFWYLTSDLISFRDFAKDRDPVMSERIEQFADYIEALADRIRPDDDLIICGHSSGTFIALRVLDRILERRPDFMKGRRRTPILLTLGSAFGFTSFFKGSTTPSEARRLVASNAFLWADVFEAGDILCCGAFNPVEGQKGRGRTHFCRANFGASLQGERHAAIKASFFHYHFGYLMASAAPDRFDLYDVAVGQDPWPLIVRESQVRRYQKPQKREAG